MRLDLVREFVCIPVQKSEHFQRRGQAEAGVGGRARVAPLHGHGGGTRRLQHGCPRKRHRLDVGPGAVHVRDRAVGDNQQHARGTICQQSACFDHAVCRRLLAGRDRDVVRAIVARDREESRRRVVYGEAERRGRYDRVVREVLEHFDGPLRFPVT